MNCERMENRLIAYLDGRAGQAERSDVEAHLAACTACRTRAQEFRLLWNVLGEVPMEEPSPSFDDRLRARIAAEPARPSVWSWLVPSPRLAFAVSLLVILSVWVSSVPERLPPPPTVANTDAEFKMIKDLPVLEDYDVLANFEALSELPPKPEIQDRTM